MFAQMAPRDRDAYRQVFASQYLSGWEPNRGDVEDLLAHDRGEIDTAEYLRRAHGATANE